MITINVYLTWLYGIQYAYPITTETSNQKEHCVGFTIQTTETETEATGSCFLSEAALESAVDEVIRLFVSVKSRNTTV